MTSVALSDQEALATVLASKFWIRCNSSRYIHIEMRSLLECERIASSWQTEDKLHRAPDAMELHVGLDVPRTVAGSQRLPDRIVV